VDGEAGEVVVRRRPRWRVVALALLGILLLALLVLWLERKPIAADYIDRELARRGVRATYSVKHLGFGTQSVENLVLGDPRRPDLTARFVELRLSWGWRRPKVALITARGVRLYGRVAGGKLHFGQLDKLLPAPSGAPFRLPDQAVDLADTAIRLDTPAGRVGIALAGRGNLADGFSGRMAAAAPGLDLGGCRLAGVKAAWTVSVSRLRPRFAGPAGARSLACGGGFELRLVRVGLDATLAAALDGWRGSAGLAAAEARAGAQRAAGLAGRLTFDGAAAETRGRLDLAAGAARVNGFAAGRTELAGPYSLSLKTGRLVLTGSAKARGVAAPAAALAPALAALRSTAGTPVGRIGEAWATALSRAARAFDAGADLHLAIEGGKGALRLSDAQAAAASGARLTISGGDGIAYFWPKGALRVDGSLALAGGGLPTARFALSQPRPGGPVSGTGRVEPYAAGDARLALGDIRFTAAPGGTTRIDTVAIVDGSFPNGRVAGLVLPLDGRIDGRGGFVFGERCTAAGFRALETGGLRLGPTRLPLCPTGPGLIWKQPGGRVQGGFQIASPRFAGRLGQSPLAVAAGRLRVGLDGPNFAASGLAVRFGPAESVNRIDIAALAGRFGQGGLSGTYSGLAGQLANVPLLLSQGTGPWSFAGGNLHVRGSLQVADERNPARFYPLVTNDFALDLAGNRIAAGGWLLAPKSGTRVAHVDILHALDTGAGRARLDVPGLRFDPSLQPEQMTPLTTGVVALVDGIVEGQAEIGWDSNGTHSTGTFSTRGMNLAATFGPVEKLTGTVHFSDLLNLVTAPGQVAEVGAVHTGIDVFDGRIRYQLLPDLKVRVEGARWPFAGGELVLEETLLDFSKPTPKKLTFRVTGMDAARFVQQMEFSNISATGTFDGAVPMIFDERGGRIIGGRLVARPEGGTLSYIGELTDKQLGAYGKLAFDALKSLGYNKLAINLNGALDGEFVAGIELDGIARDPSVATTPGGGLRNMLANRALGQLAKIPFEFNITVRGPFRAVIGTARSLQDPTNLLQSVLPRMLRDKPTTTRTVQPQESEPVR
jgi:hypothetical protein